VPAHGMAGDARGDGADGVGEVAGVGDAVGADAGGVVAGADVVGRANEALITLAIADEDMVGASAVTRGADSTAQQGADSTVVEASTAAVVAAVSMAEAVVTAAADTGNPLNS
jgi:hypothetical protein